MSDREQDDFNDIRENLKYVWETRLPEHSKNRIRATLANHPIEGHDDFLHAKRRRTHRFTFVKKSLAIMAGLVVMIGGLYEVTYNTQRQKAAVQSTGQIATGVTVGHLDAILFVHGMTIASTQEAGQADMDVLGVFSKTTADKSVSFQTLVQVDGLKPGSHVLSEYFYDSAGKLLGSDHETIRPNRVPPFNNTVIQGWKLRPTKGANTLKVYLDGNFMGYRILYGS